MIEVEKKFILTDEQGESLIKDAEFLGEKVIIDEYYDDEKYSLTGNDIWLRKRGENFELKIPMNDSIEDRISDQYEELENKEDISNFLEQRNLKMEDFTPFCRIETIRKKYKKDGFNIDFDIMDFGYKVVEIELMTEDDLGLKEATGSIIDFAKGHGIEPPDFVHGKVVEYLKKNNPSHFQALMDAKVIK